MRKIGKILVLLLGVGLVAACNTIEGVGEDIEAGGRVIQDGSKAVKKKL